MLTKMEDEQNGTTSDTLLCWANAVWLVIVFKRGMALVVTIQLLFGTNPNLPGIMTDELPSLDGITTSETFAKHLNTLHAYRRHSLIQRPRNI